MWRDELCNATGLCNHRRVTWSGQVRAKERDSLRLYSRCKQLFFVSREFTSKIRCYPDPEGRRLFVSNVAWTKSKYEYPSSLTTG